MRTIIVLLTVLSVIGCSPRQNTEEGDAALKPKFDPYEYWLWPRAEMITVLALKHEIPRDDAVKIAWAFYTDHDLFGQIFSEGEMRKPSMPTPKGQIESGFSAADTITKLSAAFHIEPAKTASFIADVRSYDLILKIEN